MSESSVLLLPARPTSSRVARDLVVTLLGSSVAASQRDVVALVVSELVTNAVEHGGEPIRLSVYVDDETLRVAVFDGACDPAAVAPCKHANSEGGRGLRIVEALALRWGVIANRDGKTVWASIPLVPA